MSVLLLLVFLAFLICSHVSANINICSNSTCIYQQTCQDDSDNPQCGQQILFCTSSVNICLVTCSDLGCPGSIIVSAAKNTTIECTAKNSCTNMTVYCGSEFTNSYPFSSDTNLISQLTQYDPDWTEYIISSSQSQPQQQCRLVCVLCVTTLFF